MLSTNGLIGFRISVLDVLTTGTDRLSRTVEIRSGCGLAILHVLKSGPINNFPCVYFVNFQVIDKCCEMYGQ